MKITTIIFTFYIFSSVYGQSPKTITVRGTSVKEISPEKMELSITYKHIDNVKDNSKTKEQEANLLMVLQQFNISKDSLIIDNISAYGWGGFSKVGNSNISLTKSYRLKLNNLAIIDNLLPKLVQTGADDVSVSNLESSKLDSTKQVTMLIALDNAKAKASKIASHIGVQLSNPVSVTEIFPNKSLQTDERNNYKYINVRGGGTIFQDTDLQTLNMRKIRISTTFEIQYEIK